MRTTFLKCSICFAVILSGFLLTAKAADPSVVAGPILGLRTAALNPTTNAPANASGQAWIGSLLLMPGTNAPEVHVLTEFLLGGDYTVSITDDASNTYTLGTIEVPTFTNQNFATDPRPQPQLSSLFIAVPVGLGSFPLPDGLAPSNIVAIAVADSNSVVDLTGTFHGPLHFPHPVLPEVALLSSTNDAPINASGRAVLETDDDSSNSTLSIEAGGLPAGTYSVGLTDTTGTNTFTLGTFNEATRTNVQNYATPMMLVYGRSNTTGRAEFPLPDGLNPTNVATIFVANGDSVVELTGSFTNPSNVLHCAFSLLAALLPGPACTNILGNALLQVDTTHNKAHNKFPFIAQGAPAGQTFSLLVNGVNVGTTRSNSRGRIALKRLPRGVDLSSVISVEADDSQGNPVFSVSF